MPLFFLCLTLGVQHPALHWRGLVHFWPVLLATALLMWLVPRFWWIGVPGVMVHEGLHFAVGLLLGAKPCGGSILPGRMGSQWHAGYVRFSRIRWWNALPVGLAPLLALAPALWLMARHAGGNGQLCWAPAVAVLAEAAPPSWSDWRIALQSWPVCLLLAGLAWILHGLPDLHRLSLTLRHII